MNRSLTRTLGVGASVLASGALAAALATSASATESTADAERDGARPSDAPYIGARLVPTDDGATVAHVEEDSPADDAGIEVGDIVESIDGIAIDHRGAIREALDGAQPGDEIAVTVQHDGESTTVTVVLGDPEDRPEPPALEDVPWVGARLVRAEDGAGVEVRLVRADSPADAAGLAEGDIVTAIDGTSVDEFWEAQEIIRGYAPGDTIDLTVERDGETLTVELTLGSAADAPRPEMGQHAGPRGEGGMGDRGMGAGHMRQGGFPGPGGTEGDGDES